MILAKWVFGKELAESSKHGTNTLQLGTGHSSEIEDEQAFLLVSLFYVVYLNYPYSQLRTVLMPPYELE